MEAATWENPHTFEEGVAYLSEGHHIDYEVRIERHHGALLTREAWLESVRDHFFMDYDGMGNEVDAQGRILPSLGRLGGWIHPSEAEFLNSETAYILWYNR